MLLVMSHIGQGRKFLALYMQRLLLTLQTRFKAVRAPWAQSGQYLHGWVRVVTNGIRADPRPRCGGLFGSVRGVCLFGPTIPWDTTRTLCLHGGVFVMSHIGQGSKFLALYMQRLLLTKQTRFKAVRALLGPKADNIYMVGCKSLQDSPVMECSVVLIYFFSIFKYVNLLGKMFVKIDRPQIHLPAQLIKVDIYFSNSRKGNKLIMEWANSASLGAPPTNQGSLPDFLLTPF